MLAGEIWYARDGNACGVNCRSNYGGRKGTHRNNCDIIFNRVEGRQESKGVHGGGQGGVEEHTGRRKTQRTNDRKDVGNVLTRHPDLENTILNPCDSKATRIGSKQPLQSIPHKVGIETRISGVRSYPDERRGGGWSKQVRDDRGVEVEEEALPEEFPFVVEPWRGAEQLGAPDGEKALSSGRRRRRARRRRGRGGWVGWWGGWLEWSWRWPGRRRGIAMPGGARLARSGAGHRNTHL